MSEGPTTSELRRRVKAQAAQTRNGHLEVVTDFKPEPPPIKQPRKPLRRKPWQSIHGDDEMRERFKRETCKPGICLMSAYSRVSCNGELHACHVIRKSVLASKGYPGSVIWDPDNGVCACERHHHRSDRGIERFPFSALPAAAFKFAAVHGVGYILEREYGDNG